MVKAQLSVGESCLSKLPDTVSLLEMGNDVHIQNALQALARMTCPPFFINVETVLGRLCHKRAAIPLNSKRVSE